MATRGKKKEKEEEDDNGEEHGDLIRNSRERGQIEEGSKGQANEGKEYRKSYRVLHRDGADSYP